MNDVAREVGSALGIAVLGSLFNTGYANAVSDATAALPPEAARAARESAGAAFAVASQLGVGGHQLTAAVSDAIAAGLNDALTAGAAIAILAAGFTVWRAPKRSRSHLRGADDHSRCTHRCAFTARGSNVYGQHHPRDCRVEYGISSASTAKTARRHHSCCGMQLA